MPDLPLVVHENRTEVTGLTYGSLQSNFSLTSFLNHEDTKLVIIQVERTNTVFVSNAQYQLYPSHWSLAWGGQLQAEADPDPKECNTVVLPLNANHQINYTLPNSQFKLYIVGEFGGDNVGLTTANTQIPSTTRNTWVTFDLTSVLEDPAHSGNVEGVLCAGVIVNVGGRVGARYPSTADLNTLAQNKQRLVWVSSKVDDNDQFQAYISSGGKGDIISSVMHVVGYWLRDSGLVATQERDNPPEPYTTLNADTLYDGGKLSQQETQIVVGYRSADPINDLSIRSENSTNPQNRCRFQQFYAFPANLNNNEEFLYYTEKADSVTGVDMRIEMTQYDPNAGGGPSIINPDGGIINSDGGVFNTTDGILQL